MRHQVAIIGGGWAGLAAAVRATELGLQVSVYEASRHWGGRARRLNLAHPAGDSLPLDNGQHILIGAYRQTLAMMRTVGVPLQEVLRPMPLDLRFADGTGLATPRWARRWPAPLDILAAVCQAGGWSWSDRWSFLLAAARWRRLGFVCPAHVSVADLCARLTPRVMEDLIEPLCVAALNTPAREASGQVFLTVLRDALLGQGTPPWRASDLLLPCADLGRLLPDAAVQWLQRHGATMHTGARVRSLVFRGSTWHLTTPDFTHEADHVIVATGAPEASGLLKPVAGVPAHWVARAQAIRHEPIATLYVQGELEGGWPGQQPMLALRSRHAGEPAQYVFHRNRLDGAMWPPERQGVPLLAFVASACRLDRPSLEAAVLAQAREQLGLHQPRLLQTVIEKRATFVCSPGLQRPGRDVAPGLTAAGDYVEGPYPATLEGAVRSGVNAADCASAILQGRQHVAP